MFSVSAVFEWRSIYLFLAMKLLYLEKIYCEPKLVVAIIWQGNCVHYAVLV